MLTDKNDKTSRVGAILVLENHSTGCSGTHENTISTAAEVYEEEMA
jgi:hypothetical protein